MTLFTCCSFLSLHTPKEGVCMAEEFVDQMYRKCSPEGFQVAMDQEWSQLREDFEKYVRTYSGRKSQHKDFFVNAAQKMSRGEMTADDALFFLDMCLILVQPAYQVMSHLPLKILFWFGYKRLRDEYFVLKALRVNFIEWQRVEQARDNKIPVWW